MKRTNLFAKIFILIFFTMTIIFLFFTYQFVFSQKESIIASQIIKAKSIAQNIEISNSDAMIVEDEITLLESVQDFVTLNEDLKSITISRKDGNRMIVTKNSWNFVEAEKVKEEVSTQSSYSISRSNSLKEDLFVYTYPVYFTQVLWGDFKLELDLKEYYSQLKQLNLSAISLGIILLFTSIIISYTLARMVAAPIAKLSSISEEISKGDLSKRVEIESNDEIGRLSNSFNIMVSSLEETQKKLKDSHSKLEERVEQRTRELNELNETLEKRVTTEITKRQEQEQLLIQQSKLASMGEMIGNIAHQWRQPLNALSLVMQNIQFAYEMEELDDEFMEKSIKKVNLLSNNMSKTIDDFRNFFRPNKEREIFYLDELVNKTISMIESTFQHHNIVIKKENFEKVQVFGFQNEFSQTILNIMNNAKDALDENKISDAKVLITVKSDKQFGIVVIEDNAGGIPKNIIEKIFEPYFTTKDEGKGTGIGLYMSKIIIEQNMFGELYVRNSDIGAKFTVKIPLGCEIENKKFDRESLDEENR